MLDEKKYDFSEETKIKQALWDKLKGAFELKRKCGSGPGVLSGDGPGGGTGSSGELSDDELMLAAGGEKRSCPLNGGNCSSCPEFKDGKCSL